MIHRRTVIAGIAVGAGGLLTGCDRLNDSEGFRGLLRSGEDANLALQRLLIDRNALAREYRPDQMSPIFRANGTRRPEGEAYAAQAAANFANWRITVDGLVAKPLSLSMDQIRAMPARSQITRHDCVEGWSAIGKWTGPRLSLILDTARLQPAAKYLVFHCADTLGGRPYYESIDLVDAFHPQTIMAWAMNDRVLGVPYGAPVRLRVERQLGYKHAKYVERIEAVASLDGLYGGKGGYWEDVADYEWYAGI
jgi:DMSO/TMAO reductase YedYZ molybdopterin-dependent catalytic subunit